MINTFLKWHLARFQPARFASAAGAEGNQKTFCFDILMLPPSDINGLDRDFPGKVLKPRYNTSEPMH